MQIREARPEEYAAAGDLTVDAYRAGGFLDNDDIGYTDELRDAAKRAEDATLLVALDDDGRIVGTATVVTSPDSAYAELIGPGDAELRMLAVDPLAQRAGIGRALVEASLEHARRAGCTRFLLSSRPDMHAAHRLYERLGFLRDPSLDWDPIPDFTLIGYGRTLP